MCQKLPASFLHLSIIVSKAFLANQIISIRPALKGFRKYPSAPHRSFFLVDPPPPPNLMLHTCFCLLRAPTRASQNLQWSSTFHGVHMDIFCDHALSGYHQQLQLKKFFFSKMDCHQNNQNTCLKGLALYCVNASSKL